MEEHQNWWFDSAMMVVRNSKAVLQSVYDEQPDQFEINIFKTGAHRSFYWSNLEVIILRMIKTWKKEC
jgi:hypothetical protein